MILSGESVTAREAFAMGLVSRVVPRADLETEAYTIQDMDYAKSLRDLCELITLVRLSDDAQEGIADFFEKRNPEWKGR